MSTETKNKTLLFKAFVSRWDIDSLVYGNSFKPSSAMFADRKDAEEYLFDKRKNDIIADAGYYPYRKEAFAPYTFTPYSFTWDKELDEEGNMTITGWVEFSNESH